MQFAVWGRLTIRPQVIPQLSCNTVDRSRHERPTLSMNLTLGNFQRHAILYRARCANSRLRSFATGIFGKRSETASFASVMRVTECGGTSGASIQVYDPANISKGSETSKGRVITSVAAKLYTGRYIRVGAKVLETHSMP